MCTYTITSCIAMATYMYIITSYELSSVPNNVAVCN